MKCTAKYIEPILHSERSEKRVDLKTMFFFFTSPWCPGNCYFNIFEDDQYKCSDLYVISTAQLENLASPTLMKNELLTLSADGQSVNRSVKIKKICLCVCIMNYHTIRKPARCNSSAVRYSP